MLPQLVHESGTADDGDSGFDNHFGSIVVFETNRPEQPGHENPWASGVRPPSHRGQIIEFVISVSFEREVCSPVTSVLRGPADTTSVQSSEDQKKSTESLSDGESSSRFNRST